MKKIHGIIILSLLFLYSQDVFAETYYIRTGGGVNGVCDGTLNIDAAGVTDGHCAWSHPFEALGVEGSTVNVQHISGGDTVIIASGSYRMGYTTDIYDSDKCFESWPWSCSLATPPAGLDSAHPTKILGEGWDNDCSNPPELYGVEKSSQVISMFNTSNIEMQCLEITDHSNCSTNNNLDASVPKCNNSEYPYGDWAQRGIEMRNVQKWYMKNINIHGITGPGIRGAEITDWTVENSKVSYNNSGGINAETPAQTPNSFYGTMRFNHVDISWNGCVEDYPNKGSIVDGSCVGGNNGGFGDGVGLAETAGTWYWDNSTFIGNVEDGLDMLYMRTGDGISFVSNSLFMHNAGNDLKTGGNTVIRNNILVGDCSYFQGKPINGDVVHCRGNATLATTLQKDGASSTIVNNSFGGNSDIIISISSATASNAICDGTERIDITNNIFRGGTHVLTPETKKVDAYYTHSTCSEFEKTVKNNLFYNTKDGVNDCINSTDSICESNPLYVAFDEGNDNYDFRIQNGSPAINIGLPVGTVVGNNSAITVIPSIDYFSNTRDVTDIGAHEFNGTVATCATSPLVCTTETECTTNGWHYCNESCQTEECTQSTPIRADVDNNGTVNTTDAMLTLRNSLGLDMSSTNWKASSTTGDVNCDGNSNTADAMLILRKSLGLDMSGTGWCDN